MTSDVAAKVAEAVGSGRLGEAAAANIEKWLSAPLYAAFREELLASILAGRF